MVSAGDKDISLHVRPGPNIKLGLGVYSSGEAKTQNTLKCHDLPNLNIQGGGGVISQSQNSKCQVLAKFSFSWEGGGVKWGSNPRIG